MEQLTEDQIKKFKEAAMPLMKWLAENFHPHTKVIVDSSRAELVEGVSAFNDDEFLKD